MTLSQFGVYQTFRSVPAILIALFCALKPTQADSGFDEQFKDLIAQEDSSNITLTDGAVTVSAKFQDLEGELTSTGVLIKSISHEKAELDDAFRIQATSIGRVGSESEDHLTTTGQLNIGRRHVQFFRPELIEEYSANLGGIRQDFIVRARPKGNGELVLTVRLTHGEFSQTEGGVGITFTKTGRHLAYHQLLVTDQLQNVLTARFHVADPSELQILVEDNNATYPIRIDPTFSDADWVSTGGFPGADDWVDDMAIDGSGNIYVVGSFTGMANTAAKGVAMWDGNSWSPLGIGLSYDDPDDNSSGNSVAVLGTDVYVGGYFTSAGGVPANNIAKWDGTSWSALGEGLDSGVNSLVVYGGELHAGGWFGNSGATPVSRIARWDGTAWQPLGLGTDNDTTDNYVRTMVVANDELYVGGSFTKAGDVTTDSIAKWNGSTWSGFNEGLGVANSEPYVTSIAVIGSDVYAAGRFSPKPAANVQSFARWDGATWSSIPGFSGSVSSLAVLGDVLHVSGNFSTSGGSSAFNLAVWNNSTWSQLAVDLDHFIYLTRVLDGEFYAARVVEGSSTDYTTISRLSGTSWTSLGGEFGFNGSIQAIATSGMDVYVGGWFTTSPGGPASRIAKWNGTSWSALGDGLNGTVRAIAVSGNNVYVGGSFGMAGAVQAEHIAMWDGSTWSALGAGTDAAVFSLAANGSDVYAGGRFANAGSVAASGVARWDGSSWSALGTGLGSEGPFPRYIVSALALSGNDLYVGGEFSLAGGISANSIARWNGADWSTLGSGLFIDFEGFVEPGAVAAVVVDGTDVYVGGYFSEAGGVSANGVANWNGSSWSALGTGLESIDSSSGETYVGEAEALMMHNGELIAGGFIDRAGGIDVNEIAKWDGNAWAPVGSGTDAPVRAFGAVPGGFFVGGGFNLAGGKLSPNLAFVRNPSTYSGPYVVFANDNATIYLLIPGAGDFDIQRATGLSPANWITIGSVTAAAAGVVNFEDTNPPVGGAYYRAVLNAGN